MQGDRLMSICILQQYYYSIIAQILYTVKKLCNNNLTIIRVIKSYRIGPLISVQLRSKKDYALKNEIED